MFRFLNNSRDGVSVVIHISNDSIGGSLVRLDYGKPHILFTTREYIDFDHSFDSAKLIELIVRLLKKVCTTLEKEGRAHFAFPSHRREHLSRLYCVLSSPWYLSETKVVKVSKKTDFLVTPRLVEDVIHKEQKAFEEQVTNGAYAKLFNHHVTAIERNALTITLNGYSLDNPYGKQAHDLEIALLTSLISTDILRSVEETLRKFFAFHHITFHTSSLVTFSTVRDLYPEVPSFVLAEVTGEITELLVARGGVAHESASFPLGRSSFIHSIAKSLRATPELAQSLVSLYMENKAEKGSAEKVEKAVDQFGREWVSLLGKALSGMNNELGVPHTLFLSAQGDEHQFFAKALKKYGTDMLPSPHNELVVVAVDQSKTDSVCTSEKIAAPDLYLSLASIFAAKIDSRISKTVVRA